LGKGEFLPHDKIIQWLSKYGCELVTTEEKICEDTVFVISGFDEEQFNAVSYVHSLYRTVRVKI
jgi:lysosomal acid lipase/cholesteryl ester hydrolase